MDDRLVDLFESLTGDKDDNWTMLDCTVNGEEAVAICQVFDREGDEVDIIPRFVSVTPGMRLVNNAGEAAEFKPCATCANVACRRTKGEPDGRIH